MAGGYSMAGGRKWAGIVDKMGLVCKRASMWTSTPGRIWQEAWCVLPHTLQRLDMATVQTAASQTASLHIFLRVQNNHQQRPALWHNIAFRYIVRLQGWKALQALPYVQVGRPSTWSCQWVDALMDLGWIFHQRV